MEENLQYIQNIVFIIITIIGINTTSITKFSSTVQAGLTLSQNSYTHLSATTSQYCMSFY